ncbi:hypothetical protein [Antribacter gilvus]|nr:hypothetical protein [Antribacter gilvus]
MSETDDRSREDDDRTEKDASDLSDEGLGATASDEPNTMEPEEVPPEDD